MVRGIPWDQLPNNYEAKKEVVKKKDVLVSDEPHVFNFAKDSMDIGRRTAFGVVVSEVIMLKNVSY